MSKATNTGGCLPSNIEISGQQIVASAPGKVILHGEHSVVYGKLAIAASLGLRTKFKLAEISAPNILVLNLPALNFMNTYDLQKLKEHLLDEPLPLNQSSSDFNWELPDVIHHDSLVDKVNNFLSYTTGTINISSNQQMSLKAIFYLISGILGSTNVDVSSLLVECYTELNVGAGTGSSASFLVSFAAVLVQYVKGKCRTLQNFSKEGYKESWWKVDLGGLTDRERDMVCKWAFNAEKIVHGTPSGIDNSICTYGSIVEFRKGLLPKFIPIVHPFSILLINTNVSRETKKLVSEVAHLRETYPDLVDNILRAMEDVAFIALRHITSLGAFKESNVLEAAKPHFEELSRLAAINHNLLSALGVSHVKLDEAMLILQESGLKGKLTGAGGGGYAICLLSPFISMQVVECVMKVLFSKGFHVTLTELGGPGVTVG